MLPLCALLPGCQCRPRRRWPATDFRYERRPHSLQFVMRHSYLPPVCVCMCVCVCERVCLRMFAMAHQCPSSVHVWTVGAWSACPTTCSTATAVMTRSVTCANPAAAATAVSSTLCKGPAPNASLPGPASTAACACATTSPCASSHASCVSGQCVCNAGWLSSDCSVPALVVPGASCAGITGTSSSH